MVETSETPPSSAGHDDDFRAVFDREFLSEGGGTADSGQLPAVVAVVAASGAETLERCLTSLANLQYPQLTVLVVDVSGQDPPDGAENRLPIGTIGTRTATVAPHFLVLRHDEPGPDSAGRVRDDAGCRAQSALNEALVAVAGAPLLLLCRDDIVFEPSALRLMVEETFRSNAAVVGPKIVDAADIARLVDVGSSIDHYGTPFSPIEPNELDQEQHDNVRDVFFVSSTAMLVRADIFSVLNGFDIACGGAVDVDFSWRARLAGARVLVAPDARAAQMFDASGDAVWPVASYRSTVSGRLRACAKSYSWFSLAWVIPVAFAFAVVEIVAQFVRRRPEVAQETATGLTDAMRSLSSTREARVATQSIRAVDDQELRVFMIRGNARMRNLLTRRLHVDDRIADASNRTRDLFDEATGRFRHAELVAVISVAVLVVFSARGILSGGVPSFRGFARWASPATMFRAYASARRTGLLGSDSIAPSAFGLVSIWTRIFLGHIALARTVLVLGAALVGIGGVYRLVRRLQSDTDAASTGTWPATAAVLVYASLPVWRNAVANGELAGVIAYACAPLLYRHVVFAPSRTRVTQWVSISISTALVAAFAPTALILPLLIAVGAFCGSLLTQSFSGTGAILRRGVVGTGGALVLLSPWTFSLFTRDARAFGIVSASRSFNVVDLVTFRAGANGAGYLGIAALVAGALALFVASGDRLVMVAQAWMIAVFAFAIVVVPQAVSANVRFVDPSVALSLGAVAIAVASAVGVGVVIDELRTFVFGIRQVAVLGAAIALVVPTFAWIGDIGNGAVRMPTSSWNDRLDWMRPEARTVGPFRVLWVGTSDALPLAGVKRHATNFVLTDASGAAITDFATPANDTGVDVLAAAIATLSDGGTARFGHLIAPMSVRYIALVDGATPNRHVRNGVDPHHVAALADQLDLEILDTVDGMHLYRNLAWAPMRAVAAATLVSDAGLPPASATATATAIDRSLSLAQQADIAGATPIGASPIGPGALLQSSSYSDRFVARLGSNTTTPRLAFGWSARWDLAARMPVAISYEEPLWLPILIGIQLLLWAAALLSLCIPTRFRTVWFERATALVSMRSGRTPNGAFDGGDGGVDGQREVQRVEPFEASTNPGTK